MLYYFHLGFVDLDTLVVLTGTGGGAFAFLADKDGFVPAVFSCPVESFDFREGIGLVLAVTDEVRGLVFGFVPVCLQLSRAAVE